MVMDEQTLLEMKEYIDKNSVAGVPLVELRNKFGVGYYGIKKHIKDWGYKVKKRPVVTQRIVFVVVKKEE